MFLKSDDLNFAFLLIATHSSTLLVFLNTSCSAFNIHSSSVSSALLSSELHHF